MYENITVIGFVGKVVKGRGTLRSIRLTIGASVTFIDRNGKEQQNTNWYSVALWDEKRVKYYGEHLRAGDMVIVSGTPNVRAYEKDGKKGIDFSIITEYNGKFKILRHAAAGDAPAPAE